MIAFLVEFLFSYFLVFFYKFPPQFFYLFFLSRDVQEVLKVWFAGVRVEDLAGLGVQREHLFDAVPLLTSSTYGHRVCSVCFLSKNSRKFATSPSPALGCYWLYKKLPANRSDCTLALR